jgi:hypothetical protein
MYGARGGWQSPRRGYPRHKVWLRRPGLAERGTACVRCSREIQGARYGGWCVKAGPASPPSPLHRNGEGREKKACRNLFLFPPRHAVERGGGGVRRLPVPLLTTTMRRGPPLCQFGAAQSNALAGVPTASGAQKNRAKNRALPPICELKAAAAPMRWSWHSFWKVTMGLPRCIIRGCAVRPGMH